MRHGLGDGHAGGVFGDLGARTRDVGRGNVGEAGT